jgi:hypothetical protein
VSETIKTNVPLPEPLVSPWIPLENFSVHFASSEEFTQSLRIRTELGGAIARLRGGGVCSQAIALNTRIFTLPAAFRPAKRVSLVIPRIDQAGLTFFKGAFETNGELLLGAELPLAATLGFDNLTWNLT